MREKRVRNKSIRNLKRLGFSVRTLAKLFGVKVQRIYQILED